MRHAQYVTIPALAVCVLAGWQIIISRFAVPEYIFPAPGAVASAFWIGITKGDYLMNAGVTLTEAALGFVAAAVAGIVTGGLIAQWRLVEKTIYPYMIVIQTTPKVAIAPLLIIWFGFGITSKVFIAATIAFFPILVNVIAGLKSIDPEKIELMRSLNASHWQIFRMARLPNALPIIFAGLQVAVVFSVLGAIVGEFVGSKAGLGNLILQANTNLDTPSIFAALACLAIIGITLHLLMQWLQHKLVFWTRPVPVSQH